MATSLAAAFHNDPYSPVDASVPAGSSTITFTARAQGADANNYSISIAEQSSYTSSFPTPSFGNASVQLAGGVTPTPSFDPSVVRTTTYQYDAMGHLLQVNQGQQTRTYQYDSLGRVISSTIPETGYQAATASYTDFGAPSQIVDPRVASGSSTHLSATIGYDSLNRPQTITYSDGSPTVSYTYNPPGSANNTGGRLANVTNGVASENYQYDIVGRPTICHKTIAGQTYSILYAYNADGTLASITYPSGRTVGLGEDAIGRLSHIATNGSNLLNIGSYNDAGEILTETYGNGISGTYTYNNQLQLASLNYAGATDVLNLTYNYGGAQDNGQIQSITDAVLSSRSTTYGYDELGRLKTGQTNDLTSPSTWSLKYTYDRYGNRLSEIPVGGTASMSLNEVLVDPTTNHITSAGYAYDSAGNMTSDGLYAYGYNLLNQMTSVAPVGSTTPTATFGYDANGLRVIKNSTVYIYSGSKVIAEYSSGAAAGSPTSEHIYRGELRLATITAGVTTYHYTDHLSVRADTDASGNPERAYGHFPFGGTWYETGTPDKWKFTSYENDIESGLNYAGARLQSPRIGRFTGPDPLAGHRLRPQSLNRYAYVNNDPINAIDPSGMDGDDDGGGSPCGPFANCGGVSCGLFTNCNGEYAQLLDQSGDGSQGFDFSTSQCTGTCVFDSFTFNGSLIGPDPTSDPSLPTIVENDGLDNLASSSGSNDAFEEGSLAFAVFQGSRGTWAAASGTVNAAFWIELGGLGGAAGAAFAPAAWAAGMNGYYALGGWYGTAVVTLGGAGGITALEEGGIPVFRVFGGQAQGYGRSWTTVNPGTVSDYRQAAGLFPGNTGQFVAEGVLNDIEGVIYRSSLSGPGGVGGGLPELVVPNPLAQIQITRVSGVNPPF